MANRITTFYDTLRFAGLFADYAPTLPPPGGVPTFIDVITRRPFGLHPWIWMEEKYIETPSLIITGAKGRGKTGALKILLLTLMMISMGGERCRALVDNMKNNDGTSEMDVPLRVYGDQAIEVPLRRFGINILDHLLGLSPAQLLRLIISLLTDLTGKPIHHWTATAIKVGLTRVMDHDKEHADLGILAQVVARLPVSLVMADYNEARDQLKQVFGDKLSRQLVRDLDRPLAFEDAAIRRDVQRGIAEAGDLLRNVLLEGPESQIFGTNSIASALSDPLLTVMDYTGVSDMGNTLIHGIINQVTAVDNATEKPRFLFDLIGQDEVYKSWRYRTFALSESDAEWQQRDRNPFKIRIVQQLESYRTVGAADSQERELAMNSINGAGMHWIFGGQSKSSLRNLQEQLEFSDLDKRVARTMGAGTLLLKPKNRPAILAQLPLLTDLEKEIVRSNDSTRRRIGRSESDSVIESLLQDGLSRAA